MGWSNLDDNITQHPKILAVSKDAELVHYRAIVYCNRLGTDGMIERAALSALARGFDESTLPALALELVRVRLWEKDRRGWRIHDFDQYHPTRAQREARAEQARSIASEGGRASAEVRRQRSGTAQPSNRVSNRASEVPGSPPVPTNSDSSNRPRTVNGSGPRTVNGSRPVHRARTPIPSHPIPSHPIPFERESDSLSLSLPRERDGELNAALDVAHHSPWWKIVKQFEMHGVPSDAARQRVEQLAASGYTPFGVGTKSLLRQLAFERRFGIDEDTTSVDGTVIDVTPDEGTVPDGEPELDEPDEPDDTALFAAGPPSEEEESA